MRKIIAGAAVVILSFVGTLWGMGTFSPKSTVSPPKLKELPPLKAVTRTSVVVAPAAISITAIRDALDAAAPQDFSGQSKNPASSFLSKNEIGLTMKRGPLAVSGRPEGVLVSAPLSGTLRITGKLAGQAGKLTGAISGLFNRSIGQQVENLTTTVLDQGVEVRGVVEINARPELTPQWRVNPNLTAQVKLDDSAFSVSGVKISAGKEAKPLIDEVVQKQMTALDARLRNDPFVEKAARREWDKMCRSIPLGGGDSGLPPLWLELRPTRAFTAQPQTDARDLTLTVGVQAETRILDKETKPSCPFPAQLQIVPRAEDGRMAIAVPIDLPLEQVSKLLEAQIKGHRYPDDGSGAVEVEVRRASLAASGDRLLISLKVKATEQKSWFGLGGQADVYIWGRPVLDPDKQILRFTDIELAVESEQAFGLLGAAARAAIPYLKDALAQNAAVDLKPIMADARKKIAEALADFRQDNAGVRIDAAINELRLAGIEFDSKTLRLLAEANGTVRAQVNKLAGM